MLTTEKAIRKRVRNRGTVRERVKTRERNEALDLEVYCLAALYILGPNLVRSLPERAAALARKVLEIHCELDGLEVLAGVSGQRVSVGVPNPSGGVIAWNLGPSSGQVTASKVVGIDGRCVRSRLDQATITGTLRVYWVGLDDRGALVEPGRYYLVVTNAAGAVSSAPITIVR